MGGAYFVEARVRPGEVAVFETATNMTTQSHSLLFDYLKWAQPVALVDPPNSLRTADSPEEKLRACCFVPQREPSELECPFDSGMVSDQTLGEKKKLQWRGVQMVCPAGTTKVCNI